MPCDRVQRMRRLKLVAFRPNDLGWWGACFRMCGASAMGMASIVNFINQTAHVAMSADALVSTVPCERTSGERREQIACV